MRAFSSRPSAGLLCLVTSGLLWGTGGLAGSLLGRVAGLSAIAVAAFSPTEPRPPAVKVRLPASRKIVRSIIVKKTS